MDVICLEGVAPGRIVATVAHLTQVRRLSMVLDQHPQGGWHVRQGETWGPRSYAVMTAVIMEASEAFAEFDDPGSPALGRPNEMPLRVWEQREDALAA